MSKVKQFFSKDHRVAKIISSSVLLLALLLVMYPALAAFLQTPDPVVCGYGYGSGYGYGNASTGYGYGYGYGNVSGSGGVDLSGYGCTGYGYGTNGYGYGVSGYGYGYGSNLFADLAITKTVSLTTVTPGQNVAYTIHVDNLGISNATNVVTNDMLPSGVTYISSSASLGSYNNTTGLWTIGNLPAGSGATLTIVVRDTATGGSVTNTGSVHGDQFDLNLSNNTASATYTVGSTGGGGGGGGSITLGGGGGGGSVPTTNNGGNTGGGLTAPPGQVLGETTNIPNNGMGGTGEVLGDNTGSLPRTGTPSWAYLLVAMMGAVPFITRSRKPATK